MWDFCGIGNACIDIVANVDEDFLRRHDVKKGICTPIDLKRATALEADLSAPDYVPGGCAANTAACIAALGGKAAFIGRIADDETGKRFADDLEERGIYFAASVDRNPDAGSTRIFCLTTRDAERSFAAFYGVQEDLAPEHVTGGPAGQSDILYLDGYALNARRGKECFLAAAAEARDADRLVAFSPSDLSILANYPDAVAAITAMSDILLCNEGEARIMAGAQTTEEAIKILAGKFRQGAVTAGETGTYVFEGEHKALIPAALPPGPVIDTNGAGDHFAGGFLYGLKLGYSVDRAARLGNLCAATVITHFGARPRSDYSQFLKDTV